MPLKEYKISMEIAGPLAMWGRPDTGSSPTSYPIPTWSAAKGVFEAVAFFSDGKAWINPVRVEICKPVGTESTGELHYQKYTTNYRGPLKETGKSNYQFSALVVADVCYRLHAIIENGTANPLRKGANPCHYLKDKFNRRLKNGRCHHTPCLGWSEFVPTYWGPVRDESSIPEIRTEVDTAVTLNLVSILKNVFTPEVNGSYSPVFQQGEDSWIREGVFNYVE
ncbi:MAG: CRISPR-associated protein Cas5 [Gammaproteobacteria bacterium]|nr:CRISPR-associated protein Cas5 [Gammaproteobacteria bacterium]